jgi:two-component system, chemotaxis family, response regulator Rcp1
MCRRCLLVVEDNPGDVELIRQGLKGSIDSEYPVVYAYDGMDALQVFESANHTKEAPTPELVLLDINLPKLNGPELIEKLRSDPRWRSLPIVIFSTSDAQSDIIRCYKVGASAYLVKPNTAKDFISELRSFVGFWFNTAMLPTKRVAQPMLTH